MKRRRIREPEKGIRRRCAFLDLSPDGRRWICAQGREVKCKGCRSYRIDPAENEPYRMLLASILAEAIKEYLPQEGRRGRPALEGPTRKRDQARAAAWLFRDSPSSAVDIFGFRSICTTLGWSAARIRRMTKEKKARLEAEAEEKKREHNRND